MTYDGNLALPHLCRPGRETNVHLKLSHGTEYIFCRAAYELMLIRDVFCVYLAWTDD